MGFLAVDGLAEQARIRITRPEAKAYVGFGEFAGEEVILAKPQTFMNLSGASVKILLEKYELDPEQMIVLLDDVDLPWGNLRIRERGSAGTHNGLKSVVSSLGTQEFLRIRLGVGPEKVWGELRDYVLHEMGRSERETAVQLVAEAAEAVRVICTEGVGKAMSQFNRKVPPSEET